MNFSKFFKFKQNDYITENKNHISFDRIIKNYNKLNKEKKDLLNIIYENNPNTTLNEYITKSNRIFIRQDDDPKLIAFYLPQFHTIPENDEWWGKGFTEWTNVTKAQPFYKGHYQPHLPDELGFYDLSHDETFYKQIELAKKYGIYGFCFHYYWFSGRRLLEKPIFNYLNNKELNFPFMLCWANEPWSRRWDGSENDVLVPQNFCENDYIRFISDIMPFFEDDRYIKIDNCPVLIIYRPHYIKKETMAEAIKTWREYVKKHGFDDLYLINTRTGGFNENPYEWGLNATVEFPPNMIAPVKQNNLRILNPQFNGKIYNLAKTIDKTEDLPEFEFDMYKTVFPAWDNTARKKEEGTIFYNSSPELYKKWLHNCIIETKRKHPKNRHFVFINAWNEWAEGAHLEPDRKYGFAYLESTLDALEESRDVNYKYELKNHHNTTIQKEEKYNGLIKRKKRFKIKNNYLYLLLKCKGNIKKFFKLKNLYWYLKDSEFFDKEYYLKNYPNIESAEIDPLIHYLFFGFKEGKNPSAKFDTNFYLRKNKDVKKAGLNPLIHYILHGRKEGRVIKSYSDDYKFAEYSPKQLKNIISALNREKTILIYLESHYKDIESCVNNIIKNTSIKYKLILIDDNCDDYALTELLEQYEKLPNIQIIRNEIKIGYLNSVNKQVKSSKEDVIIIKDNIITTPRWLQKMIVAAYSNEEIGVISPLTNHLDLLSKYKSRSKNVELTPQKIASLIENTSEYLFPPIKKLNDSCLLIKREFLNEIVLSEDNKEFYYNLGKSQIKIALDDSTYVFENENSGDLIHSNKMDINGLNSEIIQIIRKNIAKNSKNMNFNRINQKKLLYVLHENVYGLAGGTGQTTKDILDKINEDFECYILVSSEKELILWKKHENRTILIKSWKIMSKWSASEFYNSDFESIYLKIIIGLNIDLVHIQHLIGHTFNLPKITKMLGIPTILSFHDFYYICPSIHLLNHENKYCEGNCTSKNLQCQISVDEKFKDLPILTDLIETWRKEVNTLIDACESFIAPTNSTMDLYISIFPKLKNKDLNVIEHGRSFKKTNIDVKLPESGKIKILVPGTIKYHKGHDFIREIKEQDTQNKVEFHFMGNIYDSLKKYGIYHGAYKRDDFCKIVNTIKPSFIGIFSICPETYCHTLSEAWSCGIPVLVTEIGALKERVQKTGGGYFLDPNSPIDSYNEIIKIASAKEDYKKIVEKVRNIKLKGLKEMTDEYKELYLKILN